MCPIEAFIFNWYNSKEIEGNLVEGAASGGEGAGGVGHDPAHLLRHPEVKSSLSMCSLSFLL